MSKLKILTYNIHKGFTNGNFRLVLSEIKEHHRANTLTAPVGLGDISVENALSSLEADLGVV